MCELTADMLERYHILGLLFLFLKRSMWTRIPHFYCENFFKGLFSWIFFLRLTTQSFVLKANQNANNTNFNFIRVRMSSKLQVFEQN